jgi:hypothetical protein
MQFDQRMFCNAVESPQSLLAQNIKKIRIKLV